MANFEALRTLISGEAIGLINTTQELSRWYGPDSLACHALKPINEKEAVAYFMVGHNLCELRPPMFDVLLQQEAGTFLVPTETEDARQHFIDEVGLSVVPGHNLAGAIVEAMKQSYSNDLSGNTELYLTNFGYIRYKRIIVPGQTVTMKGPLQIDGAGVVYSPTVTYDDGLNSIQRKALGKGFRCEPGETMLGPKLAQHWLLEIAAQGLGAAAIRELQAKGVVPVLMEVGESKFAKIPVKPGDIIVSQITINALDEQLASGDVNQYILGSDQPTAQMKDVLLQFTPTIAMPCATV